MVEVAFEITPTLVKDRIERKSGESFSQMLDVPHNRAPR